MDKSVTYSINDMLVEYHKKEIAKDFVIYRIEPKKNLATGEMPDFYQNPILDFPIKELHALSSAYNKDRCFALFAKEDVDDRKVQREFAISYPKYNIQRLYSTSLTSTKTFRDEFGYRGCLLCQLLLASICNYKSLELRCHNVLGQIYIPVKTKLGKNKPRKDEQVCLHISVLKNMTLQLRTTTFRKIDFTKKLPKRPYYYIGRRSMQIYTEHLEDISPQERPNLYTKRSSVFHHNTIDFLNLQDQSKFNYTKMGIFTQFIEEAKRRLSKYLTISFQRYDFQSFSENHIPQTLLPETASWQAVDMIQEDTSAEALQWFCKRVNTEYPNYSITPADMMSPDIKTLLLYHERMYYKRKKIPDPSISHRANLNTHEITLERLEPFFEVKHKDETPAIASVLPKIQAEFQIKEDVLNRRFTLFHPTDYIHSPWTYVSYERETRPAPESDSGKRYFYHFYELRMTPDSDAIQFRYFNEASSNLSYSELRIIDMTRSFYVIGEHGLGVRMGYTETLDGFFFTDETADHPYMIIRSGNFLLPDCRAIPLADLKCQVQKDTFWSALAAEIEHADDEEYRQELEQWRAVIKKKEIEETPITFSLKFLKQAFGETKPIHPPTTTSASKKSKKPRNSRGMSGILGRRLNAFIGRMTDGHYFFTTRRAEDLDALGLTGHLKGHSTVISRPIFHRDGDFVEMQDSVAYVAGYALGAQYNIPRASILRIIMSLEPNTLLPMTLQQEYFAQLMVGYVRTSFYTVKPFPFKYLREFSRYYNALNHVMVDQPVEEDDEDEDEDSEERENSPEEDALVVEEFSLF